MAKSIARGKALPGALRVRPDTRNAAALAVWCGRYKGVRHKYKSIGMVLPSQRGEVSRALRIVGNEKARDKELNRLAQGGGRKGELAKLAKERPDEVKELLKREDARSKKAQARMALKKSKQSGEVKVPGKASGDKLPDIDSGTEKQNSFARDIRKRFQRTLQDQVDEIKSRGGNQYKDLTVDKWLNSGAAGTAELKKILANDDPKFWIDKVRGNERSRAGLQNLIAKG